jgi:hypothetical protein
MPLPKEYLEARTKLGGILHRPIRVKFRTPSKSELKNIVKNLQDKSRDPLIDKILGLKGKGWVLAIVTPKGKNRRIIWEAD